MVVAVALVGVVQAPVDQVVDMASVRHLLVAAAGLVDVAAAVMGGVAALRVQLVDAEAVLVYVVAVRMVQVAVMEKVDVAIVDHLRVAAARSVDVLMGVVDMGFVAHGRDGTPPAPPAPSRW